MTERKVSRRDSWDMTHLSDMIACLAANMEEAYITAGVSDYSAKDCVDMVALEAVREWLARNSQKFIPHYRS
jgi:predicted secreted protein